MGCKIIALLVCFLLGTESKLTEDELKNFIQKDYEKQATDMCYKANIAEFDFETDIKNKTKEEITTNTTLEIAAWEKKLWKKYFKNIRPDDFNDVFLQRQVKSLHILGNPALDTPKLAQLTDITNKMAGIYSTAKICPYSNQKCNLTTEGLSLEPGIENIMANSTDDDELKYVWKSWRDASGAKMKDLYKMYVTLSNEAAKANNFSDKGAIWRYFYEDPNFVQNMDDLWAQVSPLYTELHKYVSGKLKSRYGDKLDISDGLLPAHVVGNMWAQSWVNLGDLVKPFPNASKVNADEAFKKQGYTVLDLFKKSDEFYQSLGLLPMGICYNESAGAMINKPTDGREVLCHASAWDFCDGHTYRIKMCTQVNFDNFITIHHEMGHIQYYLLYKSQPFVFRSGANPGFHEAIGDTMALSVATPNHLQKINLLKNYTDSYEESINSLMSMALERVAFLPFGLLIDKWRWDVFNGSVPEEKWNSHWWEYRKKYQMVKPPVERSDATDFDPGAKYHVAGDSQYIAYFLAHILQFQFYKSLCIAAQQYDPNNLTVPLHKCDFYNSTAAGDKLRSGLSLGSSKHWSETLEILTGTKNVSAQPLLEYFDPLYKFLKAANGNGTHITSATSRSTPTNENGAGITSATSKSTAASENGINIVYVTNRPATANENATNITSAKSRSTVANENGTSITSATSESTVENENVTNITSATSRSTVANENGTSITSATNGSRISNGNGNKISHARRQHAVANKNGTKITSTTSGFT